MSENLEAPGRIKRKKIRGRRHTVNGADPNKKGMGAGLGIIATVVIIAVLGYFLITFVQVYYHARHDYVTKNTKADAIVVLGAAQYNGRPSAVYTARLDHALELFKKGIAPYIIVTGGNKQGDNTTEASAGADYLLDRGVDDDRILREVNGASTYESLRDTAVFTKVKRIKKVVMVTDGFHELRATLIAQEMGLQVVSSPAKDSPISGASEWKNFVTESVRVSLGRVISFRRVSRDSSIAHLVK